MSGISGNRPFPNLPGQKPPPRPSTPAPKMATQKTGNVAKGILGALKPGGPAKMPNKPVVGKPGPTANKVNSIASKGFKK